MLLWRARNEDPPGGVAWPHPTSKTNPPSNLEEIDLFLHLRDLRNPLAGGKAKHQTLTPMLKPPVSTSTGYPFAAGVGGNESGGREGTRDGLLCLPRGWRRQPEVEQGHSCGTRAAFGFEAEAEA